MGEQKMRISAVLGLILGSAISILLPARGAWTAGRTNTPTGQDTMYLDRRISSLEQRLNSLESSVRNLEQQAMISQRPAQSQAIRDPEVTLLRGEVEILKGKIRVLECGLMHLDERTLSAAAKASRGSTVDSKDPCRLNPETPLQLLSR
jgi:hypothetical protein